MKNEVIKTKHVHTDEQQARVYLKKNDENWFPINFQWGPIVELNYELNSKTKIMKKSTLLSLFLAITLFVSCNKDDDGIFGSSSLTSEFREVGDFNKISSSGIFEVTISQEEEQFLEITANDNLIGKVLTTVVKNELRLELPGDKYDNVTLKARIGVKQLNGLKNLGIGDITAKNISSTGDFSIFNSGTADITISGGSESISIDNEGNGNIFVFDFMVDDATVNNSGSGKIEVFCNETLEASLTGNGNVYYRGDPTVNTSISGSGSVIKAQD